MVVAPSGTEAGEHGPSVKLVPETYALPHPPRAPWCPRTYLWLVMAVSAMQGVSAYVNLSVGQWWTAGFIALGWAFMVVFFVWAMARALRQARAVGYAEGRIAMGRLFDGAVMLPPGTQLGPAHFVPFLSAEEVERAQSVGWLGGPGKMGAHCQSLPLCPLCTIAARLMLDMAEKRESN